MTLLSVQELLKSAQDRTGLSDFGPSDFMEGLTILVDGINNEAGIQADRWDHLRERLLRHLTNRLWCAKDLADHPEIADEVIDSPIVIVSMPRTGTTKLQRMMYGSCDFQAHTLWQEHMFARIPGLENGGEARRIAETRAYEKWMYEASPGILTGHPIFTDEPDEDIWLLECSFRHSVLFGVFDSPSYGQWLMRSDLQPAYDYLLLQLKYLQWQSRIAGKPLKPWLLKAPNHLGSEHHLTRIFKNPRFVFSHRDPAKCMPSIAITAMVMRKLYSDREPSPEIYAAITGLFLHLLTEHMKWRDANPGIQILDLSFEEINKEGTAVVRKIYDFFGMPFSQAAEAGILNWQQNNPRDKHGKSSYSPESIGTTEDALRRAFAPYIERFSEFL